MCYGMGCEHENKLTGTCRPINGVYPCSGHGAWDDDAPEDDTDWQLAQLDKWYDALTQEVEAIEDMQAYEIALAQLDAEYDRREIAIRTRR